MTVRCVIIGAGGHARVILDCLRRKGPLDGYALVDAARERWGTEMMGVPILGGDDMIGRAAECFIVGFGSTGVADARRAAFESGLRAGLRPETVIHDSAILARDVEIGAGCQIFAGVIVNTGARIGRNAILNTACVVEHDCLIGDHVHLATGARLAGNVRVGDGAHIGAGATVRQAQQIGAAAIVGAGAVVVRDVAPGVTVVGVPAAVR